MEVEGRAGRLADLAAKVAAHNGRAAAHARAAAAARQVVTLSEHSCSSDRISPSHGSSSPATDDPRSILRPPPSLHGCGPLTDARSA